MRLTEMMQFLRENPTGDIMSSYTHIDARGLKKRAQEEKQFGRQVRQCRKEWKKINEMDKW